MAILQIAALLSKLIFSRPTVKWWFHRFLWNSYFIPTLRAHHLADQVLTDLPSHPMVILQIPALLWQLTTLRTYHLADLPIPSNGDFTDSCLLLWQLTTLRAQHLTDQVLADLTPHQMEISQIPVKLHISLLLWELNIWQTRSWQIYPPSSNGNFTDSCETHISLLLWELNIWQTMYWQIYPPSNSNFTDFCSESSYIIPTLRAHHLADQVLAYLLPPIQMVISQIPALTSYSTLKAQHLSVQVSFWYTPPPTNGNFTDVGRSTSPSNSNFTDSCSTLKAHIW